MKKTILIFLFLITAFIYPQTQSNYDITSGDGNGVRFWNGNNSYKIHMGNTSEYHYGPVTSHSIKNNMNGTSGRGWTWGIAGQTPIAALSNIGNFQINGSLTSLDYIRTHNPNNISASMTFSWLNNIPRIRLGGTGAGASNGLDIQGSGNTSFLRISGNGNVGIGTSSPSEKFQVVDGLKMKMSFGTFTVDSGSSEPALHLSRWVGSGNLYQSHIIHTLKGGDNMYGLAFSTSGSTHDYDDKNSISTKMYLSQYGKVGIGTTTPDSKLTVKGNIHAEEVKVDLSVPGPDYVFKDDYDLRTLEETQKYIKEHGHLPNIPSAKEMKENGIELGIMNMKLLEKIEELTLYILEQEEKIKSQQKEIKEKETKNLLFENRLNKIEKKLNIN